MFIDYLNGKLSAGLLKFKYIRTTYLKHKPEAGELLTCNFAKQHLKQKQVGVVYFGVVFFREARNSRSVFIFAFFFQSASLCHEIGSALYGPYFQECEMRGGQPVALVRQVS